MLTTFEVIDFFIRSQHLSCHGTCEPAVYRAASGERSFLVDNRPNILRMYVYSRMDRTGRRNPASINQRQPTSNTRPLKRRSP
jgi:hypothetical protein